MSPRAPLGLVWASLSFVRYLVLGFSQLEGLSFATCLDRSGSSDPLGEVANGYDRVKSESVAQGRHSPLVIFHCSLTYNPADAWVIPKTDPGGLLA